MREIKFRVFDGTDYMSNPFTLADLQSGKVQFTSDCPVMQFTGLLDKNGVEIYEGYIIIIGDPKIKYIVEWHDTGLKARQWDNQSYIGLTHWQDRIKVVGNIYENPELLK